MTYRYIALFSIRHRWRILGCWLALAGLCSWFAAHLPDVLGDHGLMTKGQYAEVQKRLSREFHMPDEPVILLFDRESDVRREEFHNDLQSFLARVERIHGVDVAASPLKRKGMEKGDAAYALVSLDGSLQERRQEIEEIRREITVSHPMKIRMTGEPVVQEDVNRSSKRDMKAAESVGLPVAFALLVWTFGGIGAALIPLLAGGLSVLIAMGIMYGIGALGLLSLSVFVHNVIPMAGMAVSIDFALMMVSRYREERRELRASEAVVRTVTTSGRAVATSVLCVILALVGTLAIRMPIFQSVALAAIVVLLVSAFVNMTFVPALLYLFDVRITARQTRSQSEPHRGRAALIRSVMGKPFFGAVLSLIFLIIMMNPVSGMRLDIPGPDSLPKGTESRAAAETFAAIFKPPGISQVLLLVDQKADPSGRRAGADSEKLRRLLERDERVVKVEAVRSPLRQEVTLLTVWLNGKDASNGVMRWVRDLEEKLTPLNVSIGGEAKYRQEVYDEIFNRIKYVLYFVGTFNFIVLAWAFRSLVIPVKAIAMNGLSIGASYGILAWLFPAGRWGLEPTDIAIMIPVFIFGLAFGISMDYGIFLLSRINESYRKTGENDRAIREGLSSSSRIITSAAAIMIAVTLPFALADVSGVKQLGIGIASALFIDATVIRLILVPSLMKLFGKWNWWMPFSGRTFPH